MNPRRVAKALREESHCTPESPCEYCLNGPPSPHMADQAEMTDADWEAFEAQEEP